MKFTFKTDKPTGKWKSFDSDYNHIKLNKKNVGYISDTFEHKIHLMIIKKDINEDKNPNCNWKWITLKKENKTLQEAKDFLNNNIEEILKHFQLRQED